MNAADDKENFNKSNKIVRGNGEPAASSSSTCIGNSDNLHSQIKQNGSSPQSDCNKHPITNGAYPKVNSVTFSSCAINGNNETSLKPISIQNSCGRSGNLKNENICGEIEKGLLLSNGGECKQNNDVQSTLTQKQLKTKDKGACNYDRNSSSEDEECCIYTYKGDSNQMADLPSSFFRLDLMPSRPNGNSRNSSPDMDYLEMDFDPGPSNDRDSSSDSDCDDEREVDRFAVEIQSLSNPNAECEPPTMCAVESDPNPSTPLSPLSTPSPIWCPRPPSTSLKPCSSGVVSQNSPSVLSGLPESVRVDSDVVKPSFCYCISSKSSVSIDENFNEGETGTMVWKEEEAKDKHVTQIGTSLCGVTAVINTLLGLNIQFSVNTVKEFLSTRMRSESAPLPEYLLSRCNAGATHEDIIRGLQGASQDLTFARFFHMYPQRSISLTSWLSYWIRKGAVPIATLNLQRCASESGSELPDCWHHQMIYGVSARGIHLTNPLEVQTEARLWPQLASPPHLKVRRADIISRWTPDTYLHPLIDPSLPLWRKMNVLGQVVNVIREGIVSHSSQSTEHITIPASYSSGVTLAVLRNSPACDELRLAPELPIDPFASS